MSHEMNLQSMPLDDLAQRCAQETILYFKSLVHDTRYCFELFRRAIVERSDLAWKAIIVQYKPLVARWVNRWADKHPDFPLAREEEEDFVTEAFERFWKHFTPAKFDKSQGLDGVLKYLKLCVNGAISDIWRKMHRRQFDQQLDDGDDGKGRGPVDSGAKLEDILQNKELWQLIQTRLKDKQEYTVVYASFSLDLSPRQIFAEYPGIFHNIKEVYQCKANVWARLERDPEIREFLQRQ